MRLGGDIILVLLIPLTLAMCSRLSMTLGSWHISPLPDFPFPIPPPPPPPPPTLRVTQLRKGVCVTQVHTAWVYYWWNAGHCGVIQSAVNTIQRYMHTYKLPYFHDQTPRLLFISSHDLLRLNSRAATNQRRRLLNSGSEETDWSTVYAQRSFVSALPMCYRHNHPDKTVGNTKKPSLS